MLTAVDPRAANKRECLIPAFLIMCREHRGIREKKKKVVLGERFRKVQGKTVSRVGLKLQHGGL